MARVAVTYEQVAAVANALFAQGAKNPGTKVVRDELAKRAGPGSATGSPNTIQRHLDAWRAKDRPLEAADPAPQLPQGLAADISRALTAAASVAREKVEERLDQVQAELAALSEIGEANEAQLEDLTRELTSRTSERDSMAGQLTERSEALLKLKTSFEIAQQRLADMERDLHAAQVQAQAANGRVEEIRAATDRQLLKLQDDRDQARATQADAKKRVTDAEKHAIAAEAHLDGERLAKKALDAQLIDLQAKLQRLEGESSRASSAEAAAGGLRDQVQLLNDTVAMLRSMVTSAGGAGPRTIDTSKAGGTAK